MAPRRTILVWDLPTRLFHWSLALLVVFSYTTGKVGGTWLDWHMRSGYAILALLVFRIGWGVVGSHSARFTSFLRGPRAAWKHAREMIRGQVSFVPGHNPLGGWMIVFMLAVVALQAATGLFVDDEIATQGPLAAKVSNATVGRMSAIHAWNEWVVVCAVAFHVLAIIVYRWRYGMNLVRPMLDGTMVAPDGVAGGEPKMASNALAAIVMATSAAAVYLLVAVYPRA